MQFAMTEEQAMIVETTRAFVEKELYPHEAEIERTGHLDMDVIRDVQKKAMEAGLYAANMPEEVGGAGLDTLTWLMYEKELGRAWREVCQVCGHVRPPPGEDGACAAGSPRSHWRRSPSGQNAVSM